MFLKVQDIELEERSFQPKNKKNLKTRGYLEKIDWK